MYLRGRLLISVLLVHLCAMASWGLPAYRFALSYSNQRVYREAAVAARFRDQVVDAEVRFFRMARHPESGLSYDGYELDPGTGEPLQARDWSAASKECLDIAILIRALNRDPVAVRLLADGGPTRADTVAIDILTRKLASYRRFLRRSPGYGGYLPWFRSGYQMEPTSDWVGQLPGLDNGEWVWALLAAEFTLRRTGHTALADDYADYLQLLRANARRIFYDPAARKVRADVAVTDPTSAQSTYETIDRPGRMPYLTGEHGVHEGMMMVLFVSLFSEEMSPAEIEHIWEGIPMVRMESRFGTTWQAFWGSSHESWAYLFLPLLDLPAYGQLFRIREALRSQNAVQRGYPGLASSTNQPGPPGYLDGAGIEGIGTQAIRNNHVFALYGVFPMCLQFARTKASSGNAGLVWLLNMLKGPKMQGPLGMGEAGNNDGRLVSYVKTIDGTFPVLLGLMGGISLETHQMLESQGKLGAFYRLMQHQYDKGFGTKPLFEPAGFVLPAKSVPRQYLPDYEVTSEERAVAGGSARVTSGAQALSLLEMEHFRSAFDERNQHGVSLDGNWDVVSYRDGAGVSHTGGKPGASTIRVPGHWIDQGYFDTTGMVLNRRFTTNLAPGRRRLLRFYGAAYYLTATLNGKALTTTDGMAQHEGYFAPFEYDVTDVVKAGENLLQVEVNNPNEVPDTDGKTANGGTGFPHWGANKRKVMGILDFHDTKPGGSKHQKFNVGGIWLPVRLLEADPRARLLTDPAVTTTLVAPAKVQLAQRAPAQVNIGLRVENATKETQDAEVVVDLAPQNFAAEPGDTAHWIQAVKLPPGRSAVEVAGMLPQARLWWPWLLGKPSLYRMDVNLKVGQAVVDRASLQVGVRQLNEPVRGLWTLNGQTLRVLGDNVIPTFTPGNYTREDVRRDLGLILSANLQVVRVHAHVTHPYLYEAADQAGLMVWQDFPQQWLCRWEDTYCKVVLSQMEEFARIMWSRACVIVLNTHNENKYFDPENAFGLPKLQRGVWMHCSKPAEELDRQSWDTINRFFTSTFTKKVQVAPLIGRHIHEETGVATHPYYGFYYGEGYFDFFFLPVPEGRGYHRAFDAFSPEWGFREEGHPDPGVGAVPTASYERLAGGGGRDRMGSDEFGFEGWSPLAARRAMGEVLAEGPPGKRPAELAAKVDAALAALPMGELFRTKDPKAAPGKPTIYEKFMEKMEEHSFLPWSVPMWMKAEKPLGEIRYEDVVRAHQAYQAWNTQVASEIYRRAGVGQIRFLFFGSHEGPGLFYSTDWGVIESDRTPKPAYAAVQRVFQPILASSEVLSNRVIAGERWLSGLVLNNDTPLTIQGGRIQVSLRHGEQVVEEQQFPMSSSPFSIQDLTPRIEGSKWWVHKEQAPGPYQLRLDVTDAAGQTLSSNQYDLELLPGQLVTGPGTKPARAREILAEAARQLETQFKASLLLQVELDDNWRDVVTKLWNSRRRNWHRWKRELEMDPEVLLDFPEMACRIPALRDARLALDRTRAKAVRTSALGAPTATEAEYHKVLLQTRQRFRLDARDREVLLGEIGVRIPVPVFYGREITTDAWFDGLIKQLEAVPGTAELTATLYRYKNTRAGHWFWRAVLIYKALR